MAYDTSKNAGGTSTGALLGVAPGHKAFGRIFDDEVSPRQTFCRVASTFFARGSDAIEESKSALTYTVICFKMIIGTVELRRR